MKLLDNEVLFLDNHLLVIDKPPGLLTLPTQEEKDSVQTRAKAYLKEKFHKRGEVFVHPVHQLDRPASGIVVLARTSKSLSRLNEQIRKQGWKKIYKVGFENEMPHQQGTLIHYLKKGKYRTGVVKAEEKGSQKAILHYRVIAPHFAYVELITGRYHQIRAQMSYVGCPIRGDVKYGSCTKAHSVGIDLHHMHVEFVHPVTKELLQFDSKSLFNNTL